MRRASRLAARFTCVKSWLHATAIAFLLTSGVNVSAQSFSVTDFRDTAGFVYVNIPSAGRTATLELTAGGAMRPTVGAIWRAAAVPIGGSWTSTVTFQITDTGGAADPSGRNGADGLALVIQLEGPEAIGYSGYGLGYHGIKGGLAVEIDTWDDSKEAEWNGATEDPADHVALHSSGREPISAVPAYSTIISLSRVVGAVDDGAVHTLAVRYTPGLLRVYVDDCQTPALAASVWLDATLAPTAWIGITAATQSAWQHHRLLAWCFTTTGTGCGCPAPCDTLVVRDTVRRVDTIIVRDTIHHDRWRDHFDTVYVVIPPDTIRTHDTLRLVDTVLVPFIERDTVVVTRIDSIPYAVHDTLRLITYRDTGRVVTVPTIIDTCLGWQPDSAVCGYTTRAFTYQDSTGIAARPNPATNLVTLDVSAPGAWQLDAFSAGSRVMCRHVGVGSAELEHDVGDWPVGAYFIRLRCEDEVRWERVEIRR